jgi:hypothetical protein
MPLAVARRNSSDIVSGPLNEPEPNFILDPAAVRLNGIGVAVAVDRRVRVDCHDDRPIVGHHRIAEVGENFPAGWACHRS